MVYGKFVPVHVHTDVIESTAEARNTHALQKLTYPNTYPNPCYKKSFALSFMCINMDTCEFPIDPVMPVSCHLWDGKGQLCWSTVWLVHVNLHWSLFSYFMQTTHKSQNSWSRNAIAAHKLHTSQADIGTISSSASTQRLLNITIAVVRFGMKFCDWSLRKNQYECYTNTARIATTILKRRVTLVPTFIPFILWTSYWTPAKTMLTAVQ